MRNSKAACYADGGLISGLANKVTRPFRKPEGYTSAMDEQRAATAPPPAPAPAPQLGGVNITAIQRREKAAGLADGGVIRGPGTGTSDSIKRDMRPGTYIMPADSTQKLANGGTVPVRVSNGETEFTPEQVASIGAAVLEAVKSATHAPVGSKKGPIRMLADGGLADPLQASAAPAPATAGSGIISTLAAGAQPTGPASTAQPTSQWERENDRRNLEVSANSIVPSAVRDSARSALAAPAPAPAQPSEAPATGMEPAAQAPRIDMSAGLRQRRPYANGGLVDEERRQGLIAATAAARQPTGGAVTVEGYNAAGKANSFSGMNVAGDVRYVDQGSVTAPPPPNPGTQRPGGPISALADPASTLRVDVSQPSPLQAQVAATRGIIGERAMMDNQVRAANLRDGVHLETGIGDNVQTKPIIIGATGGPGILDNNYERERVLRMDAETAARHAGSKGKAGQALAEAAARALGEFQQEQTQGPRLVAEAAQKDAATRYVADQRLTGDLAQSESQLAGQRAVAAAKASENPMAMERLRLDQQRMGLDQRRAEREDRTANLDQAAKQRLAEIENRIINGSPEERQKAARDKAAILGRDVSGAGGKPMPASAAGGLLENMTNLRRAQDAYALLSGKDVGQMKGDPDATGFKGFMPNGALNRVDPAGVDTRAAMADLGSLVVHDRSGAAVTAAEFPRLAPFIPQATDDAVTARKKVANFMRVYQSVVDDQVNFYTESGYKVPAQVLRQGGTADEQKPLAPQPPTASVKSPEDYGKLPSGTVYTAPDGSLRRKP
jgi:hypothetical protein